MIVIVDERGDVLDAYTSLFEREGVAALGLSSKDFEEWITAIADADLAAVEAVLLGSFSGRIGLCRALSARVKSVIVAICEERSLEETLNLFESGVDDVVRKPVHPKEILARINAVIRRFRPQRNAKRCGDIVVYLDGRDPEIGGEVIQLPRRERRILEYLANNAGSRVTKGQIFSAVYGVCDGNFDESVIESHVSKLRKRLRSKMGYDPIDCKRFLGYLFMEGALVRDAASEGSASPAQDHSRLISPEFA